MEKLNLKLKMSIKEDLKGIFDKEEEFLIKTFKEMNFVKELHLVIQ